MAGPGWREPNGRPAASISRGDASRIDRALDHGRDGCDADRHLVDEESRRRSRVNGRTAGCTESCTYIYARIHAGRLRLRCVFHQTGPEGAAIIAERIRQKIEETTFLASYGLEVRITASLGIASFPDHGRTKDDLLARADQAMYLVKGRGKNGVALAEVESPRPAAVRTVR